MFARTDLAHAQQQGFSLEEISEGLCKGLAQNIADAILAGERPEGPVVLAGGVSLNQSVRKHLEEAIGLPLMTHELSPVLAAYGVAREAMTGSDPSVVPAPASLLPDTQAKREYFFAALDPVPAASGAEQKWTHQEGRFSPSHPVEVEQYRPVGLRPSRHSWGSMWGPPPRRPS